MSTPNIHTDKLELITQIAQIDDSDLINELKNVISNNFMIPEWQKVEVRQRLKEHEENPNDYLDFDVMMDEIEKDL